MKEKTASEILVPVLALLLIGTAAVVFRIQQAKAQEPDFYVFASPHFLVIEQGKSCTFTVQVDSVNGFSQQVDLSATKGDFIGETIFDPNQVTPPPDGFSTSTLTVQAALTCTPGVYTISVTGTSEGIPQQYWHKSDVDVEVHESSSPVPEFPVGFALQMALLPLVTYIWWKMRHKNHTP